MRLADLASSTATALCVLVVTFLAYVTGAWSGWLNAFPVDPILRPAFVGAAALLEQHWTPDPDVWMEDPGRGGVVTHRPLAHDGLTLVTAGQRARLLEMDGAVIHEWHMPYDQITAPDARTHPDFAEDLLYWRPARLLPNGDLIAIVDAYGSTPEGLALIKLDRHSRLIWAYRAPVHHDFDLDEAGNIYVLGQQIRQRRPERLPALEEPLLDESLIVLSPDGEEIHRVSILDAFARSPYRGIVNRLAPGNVAQWGDYLHNNNVELVSADLAPAFPFLEAGQVILSLRQLDTLAALDLERGEIVWAMRGAWHRQHDPDLLPNGNILLFDNQGDWARGGRSRVLEVDPTTSEIVWSWPRGKGGELWSHQRAGQQKLPNGNVLINEFFGGRLLEVTGAGEVVWEFVSRFRHAQDRDRVARLMSVWRYPRDWIAFEPRTAASTTAPGEGDRG